MKRILSIQFLAAAVLLLSGLATMAGWLMREAALVRVTPEFVGMVFSTALGFTVIGAALLLPLAAQKPDRPQAALGWILAGLACTTLAEYLAGVPSPFNLPWLHDWLADGNPVPGRMAPNTAVGLLLAGFALITMHRVQSKLAGGAIQVATFLLLVLGFVGLASHWLHLDLLYSWLPAKRVAVQSAAGMIVAGVGLWDQWRRCEWYRSQRYFRDDEKTGYVAATILSVIALTAGIVGFAVQQATLGKTLGENLLAQLDNQRTLFQTVLLEAVADADSIAERSHLAELARARATHPDNPDAVARLRAAGQGLLATRYSGVVIHDAQGRELLRAGRFVQQPQIEVALGLSQPSSLLWQEGVVFHTRLALRDERGVVGTVTLEQPLPLITGQLARTEGFGQTGELGVCARQAQLLRCFPQRRNPQVHVIPERNASRQPGPMARAVQGRTGIFTGRDYRGRNVIAAHGPLSMTGLGMVIKQDTEELYQPIRGQLHLFLPLLLVLVVGGAALLRSQVKPLVGMLLQSEREASARELHMRTVVDNVAEGIITFDEDGVIASFNSAAARIFGYSPAEAAGMRITALLAAEPGAGDDAGVQRRLCDGLAHCAGACTREVTAVRRNGERFPLELSISAMCIDERRLFVGIARDISERKKAAEQVQHLAHYDLLTDLPNRALLGDRLRQAIAQARRDQCRMALLFIDLDKFKPVNDTFGHEAGDLLLKQVARRLRDGLRESDTVARVGGDEFIVLLPQIESAQTAVRVAEKLLAALNVPFIIAGHEIGISASIGVAIYPEDGNDQEELMRAGDRAMYHAKENAGGAVASFSQLRAAALPGAMAQ
ncbi:diguanylate cyclase domain-containing protein [Noviherbaspirillum autotrophicum]|uniref:diguanylate cyclase domain-containing protein n=1 Tax=Noviherbaspirillum autotrophicum TaxID=709839 RepID=UPI000694FE60|nr:diguanylate cyclase [Noviherbaspirillum autotrophicum]